ncbi:hypothetical protein [uncultured Muribaculum sp.]|uniref:hypothetical protein n=1 Tax=uncultured Muribaculum sp. TaxID=1918613 RepID=UPI00261F175A|nr:hypothetical protein [uncultured Muribaculum sp.]
MTLSEILNILLGGGFLALVIGIITLKATVRKANAEAEKAKADAETVRITNTENATRILVENIVKPLKEELNATREDLQATKREMASTKREMARLRKAVEAASGCPHSDRCPVLLKLQDNPKRRESRGGDRRAEGVPGQHGGDDKGGDQRGGTQERSIAPYLGRQPPETT